MSPIETHRPRRRRGLGIVAGAGLLASVLAVGATPVDAQSSAPPPPDIYLVNGFSTGQYDFYIDGELSRGGVEPLRRSGQLQATPSTSDPIGEGEYTIDVYDKERGPASSTPEPAVASTTISVCDGRSYSLALHPDASGAETLSFFENDQRDPGMNSTRITVRHIGQSGPLDIEIGSNGENSGPATNASFTLSNGQERVVEDAIVQDYQLEAFESGTTTLVTSNPDVEGEASSPLIAYVMGSPPEASPPGKFVPTVLVPVPQDRTAPAPAQPGTQCGSDATGPSDQSPTTAAYTPVDAMRLLDTRDGSGAFASGESRTLDPSSVPGLPDDATAVVVNLTGTGLSSAGYLSATATEPTGEPTVSSLNWGPGVPEIATLQTIPLSTAGDFNIYASQSADVVVDVLGFYAPAETSTEGRFVALDPERVLDTRDAGSPDRLAADDSVTVDVDAASAVPVDGVSAVVLNVTAVDAASVGYAVVQPGTGPAQLGETSSVNFTPGDTVANQVIVPVDAEGNVTIGSVAEIDVVVDVTGYYTDDTAASSSSGLYVGERTTRALDTRDSGESTLAAMTPRSVDVASALGVDPADMGAADITLTLVGPPEQTFASAFASGGDWPGTSTVNTPAGVDRANTAQVPATGGSIDVLSRVAADVVVDVSGYFTS